MPVDFYTDRRLKNTPAREVIAFLEKSPASLTATVQAAARQNLSELMAKICEMNRYAFLVKTESGTLVLDEFIKMRTRSAVAMSFKSLAKPSAWTRPDLSRRVVEVYKTMPDIVKESLGELAVVGSFHLGEASEHMYRASAHAGPQLAWAEVLSGLQILAKGSFVVSAQRTASPGLGNTVRIRAYSAF